MKTRHLNEEELQAYALDPAQAGPEIRLHLQGCESCISRANVYQAMFDGISKQVRPTFAFDVAAVLNRLPEKKPARLNPVFLYGIALAACAVLAIFLILYLKLPNFKSSPIQFSVLKTHTDQKEQIMLADSSRISVNAGSELKYPKQFKGNTREVFLSGEAYFDIRHDAAKPFIIHTGSVTTTVLGTAFNIKEDKIKHTVEVTVTRGKVSVANGNIPLGVLTPNHQLSFNVQDNKVAEHVVIASAVTAWQKIKIHYEDMTFAEAAAKLEQRYKVKISFSNNRIKDCRFTGASLTGDNLDTVLKTICEFNNATYKTQPDGSIIIDGPGCNN